VDYALGTLAERLTAPDKQHLAEWSSPVLGTLVGILLHTNFGKSLSSSDKPRWYVTQLALVFLTRGVLHHEAA